MVSYITKAEFRELGRQATLQEQATLRKNAENRSAEGATFLSHSTKDDDLVVGAIRVLENHSASVYIDKVDPELPPYTSQDTAATLKKRIQQSNKFVLLATKNSKESKWVPWELGIADGKKGINRIAIFPAVDTASDTSWTSWEYMGLYRRIVWGRLDGYEEPLWMVWDHNKNTATALAEWLRG